MWKNILTGDHGPYEFCRTVSTKVEVEQNQKGVELRTRIASLMPARKKIVSGDQLKKIQKIFNLCTKCQILRHSITCSIIAV